MSPPIPVTVVGGYLGSGKTTLINRLLRQTTDRRIAVLVNDFGEMGIDGDLIADADGDTITLANGCVCCQIGSDLMTALWSVRDRADPPQHIIIEASGIADPGPIANHALTPGFTLDGVVVLLDAETVRRRERHPVVGRTIRRQLAAADVLVLTKADLVSTRNLAELDSWLERCAPGVAVVRADHGRVPPAALMGFAHAENLDVEPLTHDDDYVSASVGIDRPIERQVLERFLVGLPDGVLRVKGIVRLAESPQARTVVHRVFARSTLDTDGPWPEGQAAGLVVIAVAGVALGDIVHSLFAS